MKTRNYIIGFVVLLSLFLAACNNATVSTNNSQQAHQANSTNKTPSAIPKPPINLGPGTNKAEGCTFPNDNISCYHYKLQVWPDKSRSYVAFTILNGLNETTTVKKVSIQRVTDCPTSGCKTCTIYSNAIWDKNHEYNAYISSLDCIPKDENVKSEYRITVDYTVNSSGVNFAKTATGDLVVKPVISSAG